MLKLSESYLFGVDVSEGDDVTITVDKRIGNRLEFSRIIIGQEAKDLYEKITNGKKD